MAKAKMTYNVQPLRTEKDIILFQHELSKTEFGKRNEFLFLFGINNGLRMGDIVKLKVGDVRYSDQPYIIEEKTGKRKPLFLTNIRYEINEYIKDMKDEDWLFPSRQQGGHIKRNTVYKILTDAAEKLDRHDIGTHTLRKTFGYHHYQEFKDIAILMYIFNHSSQEITKRYIGITDDEVATSLKSFRLGA